MFNVYVYYRLPPYHHAAETLIRAMQARLAERTGATAQLLKKRAAPLLWMEIYTHIDNVEIFLRELASVADEYGVGPLLEGERHVECFHADASPTVTESAPGTIAISGRIE